MLDISRLRKEYRLKSLDLNALNIDPFLQFQTWFEETQVSQISESNAMALATVSLQGRPSCRTVLLKGIDTTGFLFFTNYDSRKGIDLAHQPFACATFYWKDLERQVIIDGQTEKLSHEASEMYFNSRPRESQLGAWASHQDQIIPSREALEIDYQYYQQLYEGKKIPMPSYWGGYRLVPDRFEFWQGRENRLHDRFQYQQKNNQWKIIRLSP